MDLPFHLATWNVGGPQHAKWGEFVTGNTRDVNDALDDLFETPTSGPNVISALQAFRRARQHLVANLRKFYPASFNKDGACAIHDFWVTSITDDTVAQAFLRYKDQDLHRGYSWGDRNFPDRPTVVGTADLDPALFKSTAVRKQDPQFRRFEDAWLAHMFRETPRGGLLKPMPPNKYMVKDSKVLFSPSDIQVFSYLELFFFDWCLTFFVHCLESTAAYSSFWSIREAAIRQATPDVRRVHTAKFIGNLVQRCTVVALQEMNPAQLAVLTVPPMAKILMPDQASEQMSCILVKDALRLIGWNLFKDCWPQSNPLSSRVAGCVLQITDAALPSAAHGEWMVVSAHCKPADLNNILTTMHTIRTKAFPGVKTMVLMGDLNWERANLKKLGQVCDAHGFVSTWSPLEVVPDTVNNVRSKYLQTQQAKGGKVNCAPKDHVLVWNVDNLIPRSTTSVVTGDEYEMCEPGEPLYITLPSDHAAVVMCMTLPN